MRRAEAIFVAARAADWDRRNVMKSKTRRRLEGGLLTKRRRFSISYTHIRPIEACLVCPQVVKNL
jgi:hypothetical protein